MLQFYFLSMQEAITLHDLLIDTFGGSFGIRSSDLLESALAQPQASFAGKYFCQNIFEMAAAYLFHIIKNHPFIDGNKRTGIFVTVNFLEYNDVFVDFSQQALYQLALDVATSKVTKQEIAAILKKHVVQQ